MQYHHKNGYDHSTHWMKKSVCMPRPVRREQNKGKKIKRFNRSDKFFPTKTAVKSKSVNTSTSAALQPSHFTPVHTGWTLLDHCKCVREFPTSIAKSFKVYQIPEWNSTYNYESLLEQNRWWNMVCTRARLSWLSHSSLTTYCLCIVLFWHIFCFYTLLAEIWKHSWTIREAGQSFYSMLLITTKALIKLQPAWNNWHAFSIRTRP